MRCLPYAAKRTWFRGYYVDNRKRLHPAQTIVVPIVFRFEGSRRENHGVIGPWKSNSVHRLLIVRLIAVLRFCINIQFFNNIEIRGLLDQVANARSAASFYVAVALILLQSQNCGTVNLKIIHLIWISDPCVGRSNSLSLSLPGLALYSRLYM